MNMSDDSLRDLLGAGRRRKTQEVPAVTDDNPTEPSKGLNPLDVLEMPEEQRDVVNWLSRRQQARMSEIQEGVGKDPAQVRTIVNSLKQSGAIHEALINGEIFYRVVYKAKVGRVSRGLPQDFWSRLDLDNTSFLRQVPLFQGMSDDELKVIADKLEARNYQRNEVILWQGEISERLFLIKSGIVGISRLSPKNHEPETLAYLREGEILGELSLMSDQNRASTTTATAMSEVALLVMSQKDFYHLIQNHHSAAIELSRMLVQRIVDGNTRRTGVNQDTKVAVVFGVEPQCGATTLGSVMAAALASSTAKPTVYSEYPDSSGLVREFSFPDETETFKHPSGHEIYTQHEVVSMPPSVRVTLFVDQLMSTHTNIVIGLKPEIDDATLYILEQTNQVIVVAPPTESGWQKVEKLYDQLSQKLRPEKTSLFIVLNHHRPQENPTAVHADFEIAYSQSMPALGRHTPNNLPETLAAAAAVLASRFGRNNQISAYIMATGEGEEVIEPDMYVNKTLSVFSTRFGEASSSEAHAVWEDDQVGLVSETVHIVRSYATQTDLDKYLLDVMEHMEWLKQELKQDAIAVEINQKLVLI
jgi:CRP-like cAMP-binding protein